LPLISMLVLEKPASTQSCASSLARHAESIGLSTMRSDYASDT